MNLNDLDSLVVCHECDAISPAPVLEPGYKAICLRCGGHLLEKKNNTIERTIALAIAGLLFLLPAISIPIIGMSATGLSQEASLIDCIAKLIADDYLLVALLVFLLVIAFPVVRLITVLYVCGSIKLKRFSPSLIKFYSSFHIIDTWSLLNVFFLGIIVALYKLLGLSDVLVDWGLFSYLMLLLCSTFISVTLDNHHIWHVLERECDS